MGSSRRTIFGRQQQQDWLHLGQLQENHRCLGQQQEGQLYLWEEAHQHFLGGSRRASFISGRRHFSNFWAAAREPASSLEGGTSIFWATAGGPALSLGRGTSAIFGRQQESQLHLWEEVHQHFLGGTRAGLGHKQKSQLRLGQKEVKIIVTTSFVFIF